MDDLTIARWRLRTLRLSGPAHPSAEAVVEHLLGVQAENHSQASWAVATRTTGLTETAFTERYDAGAILRTHVLRPTWHFVRPDDIRWLLELTAPRIRPTLRQLQRAYDVDDARMEAAAGAIRDFVAEEGHPTRARIAERLAADGFPTDGLAVGAMLLNAELSALIASGPLADGEHTYALLEERAPQARRLDRDEALAEIALRYMTGHGPATERDLAYWATLTLTDVRAGLAAVADRLDRFEHEGRTFWFAEDPPNEERPDPRGHLLQIFDESYRGYQDSRGLIDVAGLEGGGRNPIGMALLDAQLVGHVRRALRPDGVAFEVSPLRELASDERDALHDAAARYGRFLEREPTLVLR